MVKAEELRRVADRYHVDHIVEFQLVSTAINNVSFNYKDKEWYSDVIEVCGDKINLDILSVAENNEKRAAVTRLIKNLPQQEGDDYWIRKIRKHWVMKIRPQISKQHFVKELDLLLGVEP